MTTIPYLTLTISAAAGLAVASAGAAQAQSRAAAPDIEQFLNIRAPGSPVLAPDGRLYVIDWPEGVNQLYRRDAGFDPDAPLTQLTHFAYGVHSYSVSPDGRHIIISADIAGNEQWDLYHLDTRTGEITPLIVDGRVRCRFQIWLRDSSGFIYAANDVKPRDFYLYRYDFDTGRPDLLLARELHWSADDITPDGSRVLISRYTSVSKADIYELDVDSQELRDLNIADGYYHEHAGYLPGERSIAVISDVSNGLYRLHVIDLDAREAGTPRKPLRSELTGYEVEARRVNGFNMNLERTLAAVSFNVEGYSKLRLYRLPRFEPVDLPEIDLGVIDNVHFAGDMLVWTLNNARTPNIAYALNLNKPAAPRGITRADDRGIDLSRFAVPQIITYTSFDGLTIPAFLFLPEGHEPGSPIPFVANYHGGPESQFRPRFNAPVQYLLSQGYGVIQPNVRGSTGYGREFHQADVYTKRWDAVRDGVEAVRWLIENGYAEAGRVGAYGRSYGGFMSVACVIEGRELFGAGIKSVGIVNFRTFLQQTADYRRHLREEQYGPLSDPEFLDSISPINRVDEINIPMMIVHGLNDPRVPVGEAMQLAVELQRRGHDPEQLYFHNEGHSTALLENRVLFWQRVVRFLDRHIGPSG